MLCYRRHVVGAVVVTKAYVSVGIVLANYLRQGGYVFTLFVCLFVSRIMQKILNRFSQNSVKKLHMGHGRTR